MACWKRSVYFHGLRITNTFIFKTSHIALEMISIALFNVYARQSFCHTYPVQFIWIFRIHPQNAEVGAFGLRTSKHSKENDAWAHLPIREPESQYSVSSQFHLPYQPREHQVRTFDRTLLGGEGKQQYIVAWSKSSRVTIKAFAVAWHAVWVRERGGLTPSSIRRYRKTIDGWGGPVTYAFVRMQLTVSRATHRIWTQNGMLVSTSPQVTVHTRLGRGKLSTYIGFHYSWHAWKVDERVPYTLVFLGYHSKSQF